MVEEAPAYSNTNTRIMNELIYLFPENARINVYPVSGTITDIFNVTGETELKGRITYVNFVYTQFASLFRS